MKNRKKFHFSLEKDLKPDLSFLVKQSEKEFTEYAQKIYKIATKEKKEDFNIEGLYQSEQDEPVNIIDENYLNLLEKARLEATEKAAQIFKNEDNKNY
jgi:hypothetical protein